MSRVFLKMLKITTNYNLHAVEKRSDSVVHRPSMELKYRRSDNQRTLKNNHYSAINFHLECRKNKQDQVVPNKIMFLSREM